MLSPSYLNTLPAAMVGLIDELQNEIIADITKRIVKGNYLTPSAQWMTYKANQLRLSSREINKIIAKQAKVREREVGWLYTEAVKKALSEDIEIYRRAIDEKLLSAGNLTKLDTYFRSIAFNDTFKKGLKNTGKLMRNLTNSMASAANRTLSDAMDLAWLEVTSGAFTPDEAIFKAVSSLAANKIETVKYKSGRTDQTDTAVRRAILTSINKTAGDMQLDLAKDMGCDLVEVTSHFGARPSHAEWQGQIYSLSGKNSKYKPFSVTGYGTGDGLCGWNCRHSFYPYFEGLSERASKPDFTDEENKKEYELSQKQRYYERAIRKTKRELIGLDTERTITSDPALKEKAEKAYQRKAAVLKNQEKRLDDFCRQNKLLKDNSRVRTYGFGHSEASKASWAAKNYGQRNIKGKGSVTFNKISGEKPISKNLKETLNNEYNHFTDVFGSINTVTAVEAHSYTGNGVYGGYNDNSGIIELRGSGGDDGMKFMQDTAKACKKKGDWSTSSYLHQYRHELGHALQKFNKANDPNYSDKLAKIENIRKKIWNDLTSQSESDMIDMKKEQAKILSVYGLQNENDIDEFISECVAEYLNGKPRDTAKSVVEILLGKD